MEVVLQRKRRFQIAEAEFNIECEALQQRKVQMDAERHEINQQYLSLVLHLFPPDVLSLIAQNLLQASDFLSFNLVCKEWRAAVTDNAFVFAQLEFETKAKNHFVRRSIARFLYLDTLLCVKECRDQSLLTSYYIQSGLLTRIVSVGVGVKFVIHLGNDLVLVAMSETTFHIFTTDNGCLAVDTTARAACTSIFGDDMSGSVLQLKLPRNKIRLGVDGRTPTSALEVCDMAVLYVWQMDENDRRRDYVRWLACRDNFSLQVVSIVDGWLWE